MKSRAGITTVTINGEAKHIADLSSIELCSEWTKLKHEIDELKSVNKKVNRGWRGVLLNLMGVHLPVDQEGLIFPEIDLRKPVVVALHPHLNDPTNVEPNKN